MPCRAAAHCWLAWAWLGQGLLQPQLGRLLQDCAPQAAGAIDHGQFIAAAKTQHPGHVMGFSGLQLHQGASRFGASRLDASPAHRLEPIRRNQQPA